MSIQTFLKNLKLNNYLFKLNPVKIIVKKF